MYIDGFGRIVTAYCNECGVELAEDNKAKKYRKCKSCYRAYARKAQGKHRVTHFAVDPDVRDEFKEFAKEFPNESYALRALLLRYKDREVPNVDYSYLGNKYHYTSAELSYIEENWENHTVKEIAVTLGRTPSSVYQKGLKMGLRRR